MSHYEGKHVLKTILLTRSCMSPYLTCLFYHLHAAEHTVGRRLGSQGAVIDTRPLPLAAPGQFLRLDGDWLRTRPAVQGVSL